MSQNSIDLELRTAVTDELEWEPSLNAAHIGVAVRDGVVTLSGHVESYGEKCAAEFAARRVRGVRAVAQEIEVHLPASKKTLDDEIVARALSLLEWDVLVPEERIKVTIDHGVITLAGQVDWRYQRDEAEADLRKLSGVRDVVNTVTVKPRPTGEDLQERIRKALERSADVEAEHIQASAKGGKVVLTGKVGAWIERQTAERAAWAAPGVIEVDNRIEIGRP